jgi:hypothetical protein
LCRGGRWWLRRLPTARGRSRDGEALLRGRRRRPLSGSPSDGGLRWWRRSQTRVVRRRWLLGMGGRRRRRGPTAPAAPSSGRVLWLGLGDRRRGIARQGGKAVWHAWTARRRRGAQTPAWQPRIAPARNGFGQRGGGTAPDRGAVDAFMARVHGSATPASQSGHGAWRLSR